MRGAERDIVELLTAIAFVLLNVCHPFLIGLEMMRLIKGWKIFFRPEPERQPERREVQPEPPDSIIIHAPKGAAKAKKIKVTVEWEIDAPTDE
ncbi:hypothetical protein [Streptomyces mirabilis]|uniref:hypothetical protein n=1 Tax=Streptomyces mirabilis TaxID=68239 RepID=UPI0036DEEFB8